MQGYFEGCAGGTQERWPGKEADLTKKTKIEDKEYVYVELGNHSFTSIIINNGSSQTGDLNISNNQDDIYVANEGYIWKGADQTL